MKIMYISDKQNVLNFIHVKDKAYEFNSFFKKFLLTVC